MILISIFFFCKRCIFSSRSKAADHHIDCLTLAQLSLALVTFGSSVNYAEYGSSAAAKGASIRSAVRHHTLYMAPWLLRCAGYGARNFLGRHDGVQRQGRSGLVQVQAFEVWSSCSRRAAASTAADL